MVMSTFLRRLGTFLLITAPPFWAWICYECTTPDNPPFYRSWAFQAFSPIAIGYSFGLHTLQHFGVEVWPSEQPQFAFGSNRGRGGVAIVTGANTGIGYETAKTLVVDHGVTVILACRSTTKGRVAAQQINKHVADDSAKSAVAQAVFVAPLDLANFSSVRSFAAAVQDYLDNTNDGGLQILCNNAGLGHLSNPLASADGLDFVFQVNFVGHFLLTSLLLPNLLASPSTPRIVNLASVSHHFQDFVGWNDTVAWAEWMAADEPDRTPLTVASAKRTYEASNSTKRTYSLSKLAAILFSAELNRLFAGRLQAVAANPGAVNSDIWRHKPERSKLFYRILFLTTAQGAVPSLAAAVAALPPVPQQEDVWYLQPYALPSWAFSHKNRTLQHRPPHPVVEMLGPFAGAVPMIPRLPPQPRLAAAALWEASVRASGAVWDVTTNKKAPESDANAAVQAE